MSTERDATTDMPNPKRLRSTASAWGLSTVGTSRTLAFRSIAASTARLALSVGAPRRRKAITASTDFVLSSLPIRRKETIAEEPERTGSMPWTRPSRSNRSLNDDVVIAADLHDGADDLPEIGDADLVRVHPFGRNMDAARDEPPSVLGYLPHEQQPRRRWK